MEFIEKKRADEARLAKRIADRIAAEKAQKAYLI